MTQTSRLPGFYKVTVQERRALASEATGASIIDIEHALKGGGLDAETADKFVENVLGIYALPYGVALNVRVNGKDYLVPMVIEEPRTLRFKITTSSVFQASAGRFNVKRFIPARSSEITAGVFP